LFLEGRDGTACASDFAEIPQRWLKELAKRWARWRLATGQVAEAAGLGTQAITRFGEFLASPTASVDSLDQLDRAVLERYLAHLHAKFSGRSVHRHMIGQLNLFFTAIRQHGWDTTLPTTAMFFTEDLPQDRQWLPRALSDHVMTQLERPDNLDQWNVPEYRLVPLILMRCGLRITDALGLATDCVVRDVPPVQSAERQERPVVLQVVGVGINGVRGPLDVGQVGQVPLDRSSRNVIIAQNRPGLHASGRHRHPLHEHRFSTSPDMLEEAGDNHVHATERSPSHTHAGRDAHPAKNLG
jgi:hypothetical protein